MSIENDTKKNTIHTLENDPFLQYVFTELIKTHVAFTGELPEFLKSYAENREEDEMDNEQ